MYLSRLVLNARSRDARSWLADCHALHFVIMSGFPTVETDIARAQLGVLYRVERMTEPPAVPILVQSRVEPRWPLETDAVLSVDQPRPLSGLLARIEDGQRYRFRLRANPTRRVHRRATIEANLEKGRISSEKPESVGKRVELRREEDQIAWLARQGIGNEKRAGHGFKLITARLLPSDKDVLATRADPGGLLNGKSPRRHQLTFASILFEGALQVTDSNHFREALITGIGPGKAFGCGLLSIASLSSP